MKNEIKLLLIIIPIIILIIIIGVTCTEDKVEKIDDSQISIYVDKETGVNYYIYEFSDRGGMTVRLNPDGTPYVSK